MHWFLQFIFIFWNKILQGNCPKHVEFYSKNKNKLEKLVHLVGFIIRIYHDARSPERTSRILPMRLRGMLLNQAWGQF